MKNADNEAISDSAVKVLLSRWPWIPSFVLEIKCFLQLNPLLLRNPIVFWVKAQFIICLLLVREIAWVFVLPSFVTCFPYIVFTRSLSCMESKTCLFCSTSYALILRYTGENSLAAFLHLRETASHTYIWK